MMLSNADLALDVERAAEKLSWALRQAHEAGLGVEISIETIETMQSPAARFPVKLVRVRVFQGVPR